MASPPAPPVDARDLDDVTERLALLRTWAGEPSYASLVRRVHDLRKRRGVPPSELTPGRVTVYDCFRPGRARLDVELVGDLVTALGGTDVPAWRAAASAARSGRRVAQVRVGLPAREPAVGREELVAALVRAAGVTAVSGMAGIGKTALATAAGHAAAAEHRWDDVLFVELGGHAAHGHPADPDQVVADLVRATVGTGPRRRAGATWSRDRWQEALATKRLLVVLDDAADAEQVRPLLPAASAAAASRVIVTSRRPLDLPGVQQLPVPPLDDVAAADLLAAGLPGAAPELVQRVVGWAAGLPLALRIALAAVRRHEGWPLDDVVHKLVAAGSHPDIDAALTLSYGALDPTDGAAFRLLALHPGSTVRPVTAAALWDVPAAEAARVLDRLAAEQLLVGRDERRIHDLVRGYGARLLADQTPRSVRDDAFARLVAHYRDRIDDELPLDDTDIAEMTELALTGEGPAGGRFAVEVGWTLEGLGRFDAAESLFSPAAADRDPVVRRRARQGLARLAEHAGRLRDLLFWLDEALREDPSAEDVLLAGNAAFRLGELAVAAERYATARDLSAARGESRVHGRALSNLGNLARFRSEFAAAQELFSSAEAVLRDAGEETTLFLVLANRAVAWKDQRRPDQAQPPLDEAALLAERHGLDVERAHLRITQAAVWRQRGDLDEARRELRLALAAADEASAVVVGAEARLELGQVEEAAGRPDLAQRHFAAVRRRAESLDLVHLHVEVLERLADLALAHADAPEARVLLDEARDRARRAGDDVRTERLTRKLTGAAGRGQR